jgi:diguanylate cyclase (GGDEF)-like protein/PAS domain S-box-containing protein
MLRAGSASAYVWIAHVHGPERAAWEREHGVRIVTPGPGGVQPAPERAEYNPTVHFASTAPVRAIRGLDAPGGAPAMREAQRLEEPRAAPVGPLPVTGAPGMLVYAPVRDHDGDLLGTAVGSFRVSALSATIRDLLPKGAAFEVRQAGTRISGHGRLGEAPGRWVVDVAGQPWELAVSAAPSGRLSSGIIALLLGTLVTAVVLLTLTGLAREAGRAQRSAARSEEHFAQAFEHAPVGMALLDARGNHVRVNEAMARMLGRTREELTGLPLDDVMPASELGASRGLVASLLRGSQEAFSGDTTLLTADGRTIRAAVHMSLLQQAPGSDASILVHATDVTEQRLAERRMKHLADHDPLTGLLNRRGFSAALQSQVAHTRRYGPAGALLILDLDGFKAVNDAHGHEAGDRLLVDVSAELRECLRETDVIARLGGDEFAIILPRETLEEATVVAEKVTAQIRERGLGGPHHAVTASVGVAPFGANHESGEEVLRDADLAMYSAKGAGRDRWAVHGRHQEALKG